MGLRAVIAKSYARIHRKNLINFGMAPLYFKSDADYDAIDQGDELHIPDLKQAIQSNASEITVENKTKDPDCYLLLPL